jgi:hypothetical protein
MATTTATGIRGISLVCVPTTELRDPSGHTLMVVEQP